MMAKKINLIIGLALGVIAIISLNIYMTAEKEKMAKSLKKVALQKYENLTSVMIAKKDIASGAVIETGMLTTEAIPRKYVQPQAATSLDRIAGRRTAVPIKKGEQITLSKLLAVRKTSSKSLAMATPVGKRAITITTDNLLTRMIQPGDYVDVIVSLGLPVQTPGGETVTQAATVPFFQNVLVLAVGEDFNASASAEAGLIAKPSRKKKEESAGLSSSVVTIALTPQEINLLTFIKDQSKIQLVLRSPADANTQFLPPANVQTLIQYLNSLVPDQSRQKAMQAVEPDKIEIYRGSEKGQIFISE